MAWQIVFEVTQPVVNGNTVLHDPGEQFANEVDVPAGVPYKPVIVHV